MKFKRALARKRLYQLLIIAGVIIIPLAYSLLYLGAFWDPYSRLDMLPVAVVNNDCGAQIDGTVRNLGDEMVDRMRTDDSLKWVFTNEQDGKAGVDSTKYYAMIVIPQDFSTSVASADSVNKKTALLTYESNQKRNYLASQIINKAVLVLEEETRADVNRELTQELSGKLGDVPGKLQELSDGLGDMGSGANELTDGTAKLKDGQSTLVDGAASLDNGLSDLEAGAKSMKTNTGNLDAGLAQAAAGITSLSNGMAKLPMFTKGISDLDAGASGIKSGVDSYVAGVDALIAQNKQIAAALANYVSRNPTAASDPALGPVLQQLAGGASQLTTLETSGGTLKAGVAGVKGGADTLNQSVTSLNALSAGTAQLTNAITQLKSGSTKLFAGTKTLLAGVVNAKSGSADLLSGAKDLQKGIADVNDGTVDLHNAIETAQQKVNGSITDASTDLKVTKGLDDFAAEPVKLKDTTANAIPNYGTAFTPYFMSLSLWVGAIILFVGIYLDPNNRMPLLSRSSERKFLRMAVFVLISLVQAGLLAFLVMNVLHLQVYSIPVFYFTCILVSMVFMSIVEFLIMNLGDIGKFLSILFLILQLSACGGTFPMELLPSFFNSIYRFMPMTYSVNLLKEAIGGFTGGNAAKDVMILLGIFVVFTGATIAFSLARKKKADQVLSVV